MISTPYEIDNRSDYAGFRTRRIPATGLYTGAETPKTAAMVAQYGGQASIQADPCYHEWCDTVFNLSEFGLNEFTDALAHGDPLVRRPRHRRGRDLDASGGADSGADGDADE